MRRREQHAGVYQKDPRFARLRGQTRNRGEPWTGGVLLIYGQELPIKCRPAGLVTWSVTA